MKAFLFSVMAMTALAAQPPAVRAEVNSLKVVVTIHLRFTTQEEPELPAAARELEVAADDFQRPKETRPKLVVIGSVDDMAKATVFRDDDGREAVAKQVDFAKEKVVLFVWKGSNSDTIRDWRFTPAVITFVFKAARGADDRHMRVRAFAVPKDAVVEFGEARTLTGLEEMLEERLRQMGFRAR
jgi:hypothetical protein